MNRETILIVDDEPDIREIIQDILEDEDYSVIKAENAEAARRAREESRPDLVLLDIWMPDTDGISLLKEWSETDAAEVPVVMISGHGNIETAVEAVRLGAYDFLEKPLSTAKLLVTVKRALQSERLKKENQRLRGQLEPVSQLEGKSPVMETLREQLQRVAQSDGWVLITGEPGSGKGVVARAIHRLSPRKSKSFVDVSLAAIPSASLAVQLFGSEDGGDLREGRFEQAQGGTLFLDEIGDMHLDIQTKLLSALEEGRFVRVGGQQYVEIDSRTISATNQDLEKAVTDGRFREDLYYRLNVLPIHVPPLREHKEDVPELVNFYLNWMVDRESLPYREFTTAALNVLRNHSWPGNVRELKNLVQRLLILNRGDKVDAEEVRLALGGKGQAFVAPSDEQAFETTLREARDSFEKSYLEFHLNKVGGNVAELAQIAGMERTHLYRKLKALGIDPKANKGA